MPEYYDESEIVAPLPSERYGRAVGPPRRAQDETSSMYTDHGRRAGARTRTSGVRHDVHRSRSASPVRTGRPELGQDLPASASAPGALPEQDVESSAPSSSSSAAFVTTLGGRLLLEAAAVHDPALPSGSSGTSLSSAVSVPSPSLSTPSSTRQAASLLLGLKPYNLPASPSGSSGSSRSQSSVESAPSPSSSVFSTRQAALLLAGMGPHQPFAFPSGRSSSSPSSPSSQHTGEANAPPDGFDRTADAPLSLGIHWAGPSATHPPAIPAAAATHTAQPPASTSQQSSAGAEPVYPFKDGFPIDYKIWDCFLPGCDVERFRRKADFEKHVRTHWKRPFWCRCDDPSKKDAGFYTIRSLIAHAKLRKPGCTPIPL